MLCICEDVEACISSVADMGRLPATIPILCSSVTKFSRHQMLLLAGFHTGQYAFHGTSTPALLAGADQHL